MVADTPKKKVLVVEDEKPLAHALELKLTHEGFAATVARNGQEALDLIRSQPFDVVLLDMMMPIMDGFHVLENLQDMQNKPVIFVLSNLSTRDDEGKILALGAKKYFIKSNTPLAQIVAEVKAA